MGLRDDLRAIADNVRSIRGPSGLDVATSTVLVVTRTWSGGRNSVGTPTEALLALPGHLVVRQLSTREILGSGGLYEQGDLLIPHITPSFTDPSTGATGGFTPAQLNPRSTVNGVEVFYRITGPHAGEYAVRELRSWQPFSYEVVLTRRNTKPSVNTP